MLRNHPSLRLSLLFILGIIVGHFYPEWREPVLWLALTSILISLILAIYSQTLKSLHATRFLVFLYFSAILTLGAALGAYSNYGLPNNTILNYVNEEVWLKGEVASKPVEKPSHSQWVLKSQAVLACGDTLEVSGNVLVSAFFQSEQLSQIKKEDEVWVFGAIKLPAKPIFPNTFNFRKYLANQNIFAQVHVFDEASFDLVPYRQFSVERLLIQPIRTYIKKAIDELFIHRDSKAFLNAALLGDRYMLSEEVKTAFQKTGTYHLLAISGLHVGLIFLIITTLLQRFRQTQKGKWFTAILTTMALLVYAEMTGNAPPVQRATIMALVFAWSGVLQRKPNALNTLAFADFLILLIFPNDLFNLSFLLFNAAVVGILGFYPKMVSAKVKQFFGHSDTGFISAVKYLCFSFYKLFAISFGATIGVWPLLAYYFHQLPVVGQLINIPVTIFSILALQSALPALICFGMFKPLAILFASFSELMLELSMMLTTFFSHLSYAAIEIEISLLAVFVVFGLILTALTYHNAKLWPKFFAGSLLLLNVWIWLPEANESPRIIIHQFDKKAYTWFKHSAVYSGFQFHSAQPDPDKIMRFAGMVKAKRIELYSGFLREKVQHMMIHGGEFVRVSLNEHLTKVVGVEYKLLFSNSIKWLYSELVSDCDIVLLELSSCSPKQLRRLRMVLNENKTTEFVIHMIPEINENEQVDLAKAAFETQNCKLLNYESYVTIN